MEGFNKDYKVSQFLDIYLKKYIDKNDFVVTELAKKIRLTIDIPTELQKEGRKFHVLRTHTAADGKTTVTLLEDLNADVNTYTFETDSFSTYALLHEDKAPIVEEDKPEDEGDDVNTADTSDVILYSVLCILGLVGVAFVVIAKRKKKFN